MFLYLQVNEDRIERRLGELRRVVDGITVENDELEGLGKLKDPFDLVLNKIFGVSHRHLSNIDSA